MGSVPLVKERGTPVIQYPLNREPYRRRCYTDTDIAPYSQVGCSKALGCIFVYQHVEHQPATDTPLHDQQQRHCRQLVSIIVAERSDILDIGQLRELPAQHSLWPQSI